MRDGNRVSGVDRKDCPFYDIFDSILGTRAATEPPLLLESSEPPVSTANLEHNEFEGGTFVFVFNAYSTISWQVWMMKYTLQMSQRMMLRHSLKGPQRCMYLQYKKKVLVGPPLPSYLYTTKNNSTVTVYPTYVMG